MYRAVKLEVIAAEDSSLAQILFRAGAFNEQTRDLEVVQHKLRIDAGASELTVSYGTITNGKFIMVLSDYPVRVRLNGAAATQFVGNSTNVQPISQGAAVPYQFAFGGNVNNTECRIQPIASATQTANVTVIISGDPTDDYT